MILFCPNCKRIMEKPSDVRVGDVIGCKKCIKDAEPEPDDSEDLQPGKAEPIWPEEFER